MLRAHAARALLVAQDTQAHDEGRVGERNTVCVAAR